MDGFDARSGLVILAATNRPEILELLAGDRSHHRQTILREKRDVLERSARKLLEKETLDEKDLTELIGPPPASPPMRVAAE
jgi:ATP-dependent Zn protease